MGLDPISLGIMAIGTGMQAYGQRQEGQAADTAAEYNQQVLEREAQAKEQKSLIESRRQAGEASRKMSSLRAGLGASGVATGVGAPLEILSAQAQESELENLMIGYEGQTEAAGLREQGKMARWEGKQAKKAGAIGAGATLLSGFGGMANDQGWFQKKK